jgi:N-carbamoyl-L-amino-acid hydrolase
MTKKRDVDRIQIDQDGFFGELMELGKIGYVEDRGVTRPALSDADMEARRWLERRMIDLGLEIRIDAAFNMIGTLRSPSKRDQRVLAIGSHLDTVPQGGRFDGALGVLAGLECVRFLQENGVQLPWDLEIIDFTDEEAAHHAGTVGSRAMMGLLEDGEIYRSASKGRPSFADDLRRHGGEPQRIGEARRDPSTFLGMLELHIEQGSRLEAAQVPIGVVTGIVGIYRYTVTIVGEAGHAGTTPMSVRDDALVKAAPLFTLLPEWVKARNREMVGTIGRLTLEPGAVNVVPGKCKCVVELRSLEPADMAAVRDLIEDWVGDKAGSSVETIYEKDSVVLSEPIMAAISRAADIEGLPYLHLASGAGHDAQTFASFVPTGMVFVPCRLGQSHSPAEWSEPRQVADGCRVLIRTVLELAEQTLHKK